MYRLPKAEQPYYYANVKGHFEAHKDEPDEERIQQLLERGRENMLWIMKKVSEYVYVI